MASAPRRARVLIVDDNPPNLLALAAVLESDYELAFANSGTEAIKLLEARADIDVILMDVHMPGLDGFETAARIKKMNDRAGIPIIFVTAVYQDDPFVKRGYEVGGIDYFSKPFDPEILKMKIAAYAAFRLKADLLRERELHIRESEELLRVGRKLSSMLESLPVGDPDRRRRRPDLPEHRGGRAHPQVRGRHPQTMPTARCSAGGTRPGR